MKVDKGKRPKSPKSPTSPSPSSSRKSYKGEVPSKMTVLNDRIDDKEREKMKQRRQDRRRNQRKQHKEIEGSMNIKQKKGKDIDYTSRKFKVGDHVRVVNLNESSKISRNYSLDWCFR